MLLFWRRFRAEASSLAAWSLGIGATGLGVAAFTLLAGNLRENAQVVEEFLTKMPIFAQMLGGVAVSAHAPSAIAQSLVFTTIAPILLLIYTSLAVLGIFTRDASQGNLEFLLALPVRRSAWVVSRGLVFLVNLGILQAALVLGVAAGLRMAGEPADLAVLTKLALNLYALFACLGGLGFLISLFLNDYTRGLVLILGLQFGLFVLNIATEDRPWAAAALNPYHYYRGAQMLGRGGFPTGDVLLLAVLALAFWAAGTWQYTRKQI
ncbi:MAG: ABC transporter permease subunit [Firmicutes bacterium]|nr:ABC transporter permease subunit [Bacillota bacterium]